MGKAATLMSLKLLTGRFPRLAWRGGVGREAADPRYVIREIKLNSDPSGGQLSVPSAPCSPPQGSKSTARGSAGGGAAEPGARSSGATSRRRLLGPCDVAARGGVPSLAFGGAVR